MQGLSTLSPFTLRYPQILRVMQTEKSSEPKVISLYSGVRFLTDQGERRTNNNRIKSLVPMDAAKRRTFG